MSAAGRDQRVSAAVVSSRIIELEKHLGVRLFHRTTRKLTRTINFRGRWRSQTAKEVVEHDSAGWRR